MLLSEKTVLNELNKETYYVSIWEHKLKYIVYAFINI